MITKTLKIAFQGAPGAFSQQAGSIFAEKFADEKKPGFMPCASFEEVFNQVVSGSATYGVIPLENSSIGSITANYDLLWSNPVTIIGEVTTPIHHNLIGLPGASVQALKEVYSHPAALDQCRKFFASRPGIRPVVHFDTGGAVKFIAESGDASKAAIAGESAAQQYAMEVIMRHVEDYPDNTTRFAIISLRPDQAVLPDAPFKLSCGIELENQSGALAAVLAGIAEVGVNLTKIESRPIPEARWHYRFFLDLLISEKPQDPAAVKVLNDATAVYKIFGRYAQFN